MPRLLPRWLRKAIAIRLPGLSKPVVPSRFIEAKFTGPLGSGLSYRLFLPSGSARNDSLPLLVMLHGCQQDAPDFAGGSRMNELAEEERCAVLYPQQSASSNPLRCWNWFESASLEGQGEAALIAALIEQVACRRAIDSRRIYVAGFSAGGAMACILALRHSELFAACAIHSGLMYGAAISPVRAFAAMQDGPTKTAVDSAYLLLSKGPGVVVPTLVIQGDADTTVNPLNAQRIIEQIQKRDEALDRGAAVVAAPAEHQVAAGVRAYLRQDFLQRGRLVLRQILVEGLGHAWSGGDARHAFNDTRGPDASRLILDFARENQREVPLPPKLPAAVPAG
jgi:poly(hydroxyalkanoate) depolymerase family esterase